MRIISGSAKGRKLVGFSGTAIRPTSDRVREAIFSTIFSQCGRFSGMKVLDLYAGTGAMAIEALSRGALSALFVDQSRDSGNLIRRNLESTGLADKGVVSLGPARQKVKELGNRQEKFDLIFVDPPYNDESTDDLLQCVNDFGLLQSDGILCVETSSQKEMPKVIGRLVLFDRRTYGATAVNYYRYDALENDEQ